jgi:transcriptional regulator with AAA-type ATPase domain
LVADLEEAMGDTFCPLPDPEQAHCHWEASLRNQDDPLRRSAVYLRMAFHSGSDGPHTIWRHLQAALRETDGHPDSPERCRALTALVQAGSPDSATNRMRACEAVRLLRRHPAPRLWVGLLLRLAAIRDRRRLRLGRNRRLLRRSIRLAEEYEWWDQAIVGRWELAQTWRGVDLGRAIAGLEDALYLAKCYLPPQSGVTGSLLQSLGRYQLANGETAQARRCQQLGQWGATEMIACGADALIEAECAWKAFSQAAHTGYASGCVTDVGLSQQLSRWQRLAQRLDRQAELKTLVAHLAEAFPQADAPQWLSGPASDQASLPLSQDIPVRALVWHAVGGDDRHTVRAADEVEIRPGPEVGLGWLNTAPCLLADVTGDFELQVRVGSSGHPQRAGGIVVWQGRLLLRLGSGIDHIGQVSLCQADGLEMRYAGVGCLPAGPVWLRLCRHQRRYTTLVSSDGATWYDCGQLEFGTASPIEVGLFAECNYEFGFPQPFPVQYTDFRLRVDASEHPTGTGRHTPLAPPSRSPVYPLPQCPSLFHGMVGQGRVFRAFCERLRQAARSALPLLITGETGTGKELAAQAVHRLSDQQSGPFVPVSVAALPPELIESELFGYKRGAFTGAAANRPGLFVAAAGGILFLDEIGDLPLAQQAKLLRVLDKGEVRPLGDTQTLIVTTRCLAATNRDLQRLVGMGQFRDDLFYRLGQPLVVPPLRSRREDIPYLVSHFLTLFSQSTRYQITAEAMQKLLAYDWPGNVRELRGVVEGAIGMSSKGLITVEHLVLNPAIPATPSSRLVASKPTSAEELACLLRQCNGDITALSRRCGVSRKTVYRWFERYRLNPAALRDPAHP